MKAVFYFDYSDYRSYLMMHALDGVELDWLEVQWRSVDAYSLRAMSGCTTPAHTPLERAYERQEAERFCRAHEIEFSWHAEPIHSGTAHGAGIWLMTHVPGAFESYARRVLSAVWAHGRLPDAALIRGVFEALDVDPDRFFNDINERESFQFQDACLQDALSVGVFDVPGIVVGKAVFMRYDQGDGIRLEAMAQWLSTLPRELLAYEAARLLAQLPKEAFCKTVARLQASGGAERKPTPRARAPRPSDHVRIDLSPPKAAVSRDIQRAALRSMETPMDCRTIAARASQTLSDVLAHSHPGVVNICTTPNIVYSEDELLHVDFDVDGERILFAFVRVINSHGDTERESSAIVCIRVDAAGRCYASICGDGGGNESIDNAHGNLSIDDSCSIMNGDSACCDSISRVYTSMNGCMMGAVGDAMFAILSPNASRDLSMARFAAYCGASLICRCRGGVVPVSEAMGCLATAWVIEFSEAGVCLVDAHAHRCQLPDEAAFSLDKSRSIVAPCWQAAAPRTLLLLEKAVSFGDIDAQADIELACRGIDLTIVTANQESNISHARDYIAIRVADNTFDIIPMSGDAIYAYEVLLYRTICTINRAPKRSYPICVNYWADLEYEMLDVIRPIHAAIAASLHIPILLVVANQLVEIWLCSSAGTPYRIEKDGDAFQIDFADLVSNSDLLQKLLETLDISTQTLTQRIEWRNKTK